MRKCLFIIIVLLFFSSCITYSTKSRGNLSDAMEKARDDYPDEREVPESEGEGGFFIPWDYDDDEYYDNGDDDYYDDFGEDPVYIPLESYFSYNLGVSIINGPYFSSATNHEILIGDDEDTIGFYFYGAITILEENSNHDVSLSIKNSWIMDGGVEFRLVPLGRREFLSPYLAARVGGILLSWEFQNSLNMGDITHDTVGGMSLGVGVGLNIINSEFFRMGISCKPRLFLYSGQTVEGFNNEYFGPSGDVLISADIGLKL